MEASPSPPCTGPTLEEPKDPTSAAVARAAASVVVAVPAAGDEAVAHLVALPGAVPSSGVAFAALSAAVSSFGGGRNALLWWNILLGRKSS